MVDTGGYTRPVHVLFVCTANMCRSPMAAALFDRCRADVADRVDAANRVGAADAGEPAASEAGSTSISSAGLLPGGNESPPEVIQALAELGLDIAAHRSLQVSPELVSSADVVVCMARRHAREVVLLDAAAFPRTFTLKDVVHRGDLVGPRAAGESLTAWTDRLHHGRQRSALVGDAGADDVPDPLGGELDDFRATAREARRAGGTAGRIALGGTPGGQHTRVRDPHAVGPASAAPWT